MWLAPATMACTKVKTLRPGRNPPARSVSRTVASTKASKPRRDTNVATNTSPASATKPGSSKTTFTLSIPRDTGLTESASWFWANCVFDTAIVPGREAFHADGRPAGL
jgi:hypothetical protein